MARIEISGLSEFALALDDLQELPAEMLDDILNAQADIVEAAQKKSAIDMGVYRTGATANSIKRGKPVKTKDGRALYVAPQGSVTRGKRKKRTVRLAEIAFINEYGTHKQAPRPFIASANEKAAPEAAKAAEKLYDEFLKRKGL